MRNASERVRDMIEAIAAIERHLSCGKEAFQEDELLQGWFVRNLQILGEAARALPEDARGLVPGIEWPNIVGMRNVLVHGYFDIDAEIVWETAFRDAPALRPRLELLLKRLDPESAESH